MAVSCLRDLEKQLDGDSQDCLREIGCGEGHGIVGKC